MKRLFYSLIIAALISTLALGAEVRKLTQEDIEWGDPSTTVTSAAGHVGHRIDNTYKLSSPWVDVRAYLPAGYVTDGSVDYSTYIQQGIDNAYARGGGVVLMPPTMAYKAINLILKNGVILMGSPGGYGYLPPTGSQYTRTKIVAAGTGIIIDTPIGGASNAGVIGIDFYGLGSGTAVKGIKIRSGSYWSHFKNLHFANFADEAILVDIGSAACVFEGILVMDSVLNRSRAAIIGAVDIHGTDHFLNKIEATISGSREGTVQSASLYLIGILLRGSNCFVTDVVGEISDIGIYVLGDWNRFSNARADRNYGHGFYVVGGSNQFSNCLSLSNSQDTTNTYDNWHATSASAQNLYSNCMAGNVLTNNVRYGFYDNNVNAGKNNYVNCKSVTDAGTANYYLDTSSTSTFSFPSGVATGFTDGDTTPSVEGYMNWEAVYTDNTTITNFDGGLRGQTIYLKAGGPGYITIQNGVNIYTNTAADKVLGFNQIYMFYKSGPYWFEH